MKNDDAQDSQAFLNTQYCSQCGMCEMVACKQGLNPRTLIGFAKASIMKNGLKNPNKIEAVPRGERNMRRLTTARLRQKLGLEKYNNPSPLSDAVVSPDKLYISMRQNIGKPGDVIVKEGQMVKKGECIVKAPENALGLPIHSPIDGTILKISNDVITVKSAERE